VVIERGLEIMSGININSIASLEELEASIARFATETKNAVEAIQRQVQTKTELLNQIVAERRRVVAKLQAACEAADNEQEARLVQKRLEQAEEELGEARRWQSKVEEARAGYKKHIQQASYLAENHLDKSRVFLRSRVKDLYDYLGLSPRSSMTITTAGLSADSAVLNPTPSSILLPAGFGWISFNDLMPEEMQQLPDSNDYRKGLSEIEMQDGLRLLQTRILPEIQKDPDAVTVERFLELDRAENRSGANSMANIFAAYFGNDRIQVSRMEGDQHFRIGNGRHRIKAAQGLGWTSLPGKIVEVPPKSKSD
jgi:hypothetical protein